MCGIAGMAGASAAPEVVQQMVLRLRHRGPDGTGVSTLDGCVLGHSRLSIIDLDCGAQPMCDASRRRWITFNGELYNFRELRRELAPLGYRFRTRSDTEVILAAYDRWGPDCVHRFRGMFAFAIWDTQERSLFAARDLFGEKPFYWASLGDGSFTFASELKAIVRTDAARSLDLGAVDAFLALGYVPPDRTIYRGIETLPPGHSLRWQNGAVSVERYWSPRPAPRSIGLDEAAERLRHLVERAVDRQTVADVPIGAFLSGGLDSSTIVALLRDRGAGPVRTFSVGFGEYINELPYAAAVARQYGTDHHEVDLGNPPVGELLQRMAQVYDEPFADPSHIPTYLISEFARRHVKVVLSGDGGDEMFGGYAWYLPLAKSERAARSLTVWLLLRIASRAARDRVRSLHRCSVAVGLASRWPDMWMRGVMSQVYLRATERRSLWGGRANAVAEFQPGGICRPDAEVEGLDRAFYYDLTCYLPGDILVKVDRAAMAHGLETRAPFLDRDVAEFALSLPAALKVSGDETKRVLRRAFEERWPQALRGRPKQGFGAPYAAWLGSREVRALVQQVFRRGGALCSLLPGASARAGGRDYRTWTLLTLGLWLENNPVDF